MAEGTFELFLRYLREPLLARDLPARVEAERMAAGLRLLLQSVGHAAHLQLPAHDPRGRPALPRASTAPKAEQAALAKEVRRHFELVPLPEGA